MKKLLLIAMMMFPLLMSGTEKSSVLKAYYTRLPYDDGGYTGKYADIVVSLPGKGQLVFSRESGYLPYWQPNHGGKKDLDVIVSRFGPVPGVADRNNLCSNVAIVENSDSLAIVHWRYAADMSKDSFTCYVEAYNRVGDPSPFYAEYVDEYFEIRKNGRVSRLVREGCYDLDEWNDPYRCHLQELLLSESGIECLSYRKPALHVPSPYTVNADLIKPAPIMEPLISFSMDDALYGARNMTEEHVSGIKCVVGGVKAYWDKGVSGSCLNFDSYSNYVVFPGETVPAMNSGNGFSISAWIAPQEYSFNVSAIVDHMKGNTGYFLGIDREGRIDFRVGSGTRTCSLRSQPVELYRWSHVAAVYDAENGVAEIFIDGHLAAKDFVNGFSDSEKQDFVIGRTISFRQYPKGAERDITRKFETEMVFSGLIDEVSVFGKPLSEDDLSAIYASQKPVRQKPLRPYTLPDSPYRDGFGAFYTKLSYNPGWDGLWRVGNYADIVVTFEHEPWRYVFWRGTRYLPSLVTDYGYGGIWSNDQGPEIFPGQCYEHMSDMLCRYTNVRLISSTPARVIVHWRNASVNIEYEWPYTDNNGWGVWTDEYWTIYPDGTSVRHQLTHNSENHNVIEMNQNEILHHPGQITENLLKDTAVVTGNHDGKLVGYSRLKGNMPENAEANLLYTNLNSSTKQFQIGEVGTRIDINLNQDVWWYGWDHYPCQLIPSDGTQVCRYDRGGSSCPSTFREVRRKVDDITVEAMQIYGLTRKSPEELLPLNRSWNFAPSVTEAKGTVFAGYAKEEKAYIFEGMKRKSSFIIQANHDSPVVNPAFVFGKCGNVSPGRIRVTVNGVPADFRCGTELDGDGDVQLVLWIEMYSEELTNIIIHQL